MLGNQDLIIIAIGFDNISSIKSLSSDLGIVANTVKRHLKTLFNRKEVDIIDDDQIILTVHGVEYYNELVSEIMDHELTPEQHSVSKVCKIGSIFTMIPNSKTLIKILNSLHTDQKLDVIELIRLDNALKPGSYDNIFFDELMKKDDSINISTDERYKDLTMLGMKKGNEIPDEQPIKEILIMADLKRRSGKVWEGFEMFSDLLYSRKGLLPGYWIICLIGWLTCIKNIYDPEKSLELIDKYLNRVNRTEHKALLLYLKADILSDSGQNDEADVLFLKSLRMMRALNMNLSKAELLNSYGVHLYRSKRYSMAEKQWKISREICTKNELVWLKSITEINLSDLYSKKGKIRSAHYLLNKAQKVLERIGDKEGISGVHFNRSIVYIREGKIERGLESFEISEEFPLHYKSKKMERRQFFNECLRENGHPHLQKPI